MTKRYYAPYTEWECYKNGMYGKEVKIANIQKSANLLTDFDKLRAEMLNVTLYWPVSTKHNFTNTSSNCKSWLGQAACCYAHGSTEYETRMAWNELSKEQQQRANLAASQIIHYWDELNNFKRNEQVKEVFGA